MSAVKNKKFGRPSCGVAVYYKNKLEQVFERIMVTFQFGVIFKLPGSLFGKLNTVILIALYLPPETSPRYDGDEKGMELLEDLLLKVRSKYCDCSILILGDLNARTGILQDYIVDDDVEHMNDIDQWYISSSFNAPRKSKDKTVNKFGLALIELCCEFDVHMLNGRHTHDVDGNFTYISTSGCSVIDYIILSSDMMNVVRKFSIEDYDISHHMPLMLTLEIIRNEESIDEEPQLYNYEIYKWNENLRENYIMKLEDEQVLAMVDLFNYTVDENLDEAIIVLRNIVDTAANNMKRKATGYKSSEKPKQPNWWNIECEKAKREKFTCLNKFRRSNDTGDFRCYVAMRNKFKELCKRSVDEHRERMNKELMDVRNSPNLFWRKLKNNIAKSKMNSNMSPKTFVLHFSELYNVAHITNDEFKLFIQKSIDTHDISCKCCRDTDRMDTDDLLFLNSAISEKEIYDAIMSMSNNKSPGLDGIVIELIKAATSFYIPMLEKLFNKILDSGIYPEDWCKAILCPIHKKGSVTDPKNYRGISLLPVVGKVFTKILNQRLNEWADHTNMRQEEQAGFRKGYSTADQIFNLQCIVQKYIAREKGRCHILFVDFATAFDQIPHSHLFFKLIKAGVHGKTLTILRSMYEKLKTCIRTTDGLTEFFTCLLGTRQGCMLSPFLFALYIEELLQMLKSAGCKGIYIDEIADNVMALLFADDVAMCSETVGRLREMIRVLEDFSKKWQLKINLEKTKIMVFRRGGKIKNNEVFYYEDKRIEIVNSYKYLGIFSHPV